MYGNKWSFQYTESEYMENLFKELTSERLMSAVTAEKENS